MSELPYRQVHLDFHTSEHIKNIGSMFDKEQFKRCLKKGHLNSITLFAKCHHGWAYFPSETNEMHPGLHFDLLSAMIDACREAGVASQLYISAGYDEKYFFDHPEDVIIWRPEDQPPVVTEKDGVKFVDGPRTGYHMLCMNSPYLDVLVKQVEEVVQKFAPIDILLDIVAERTCFCQHCRREIEKRGWDVNDVESYRRMAKITYKKYYDAVNGAANRIKPGIRLFHNGGHIMAGRRDLAHANTHLVLESLPTGGWGYDHFPKSAKYAAMLGIDYMGMTGKFHLSWGEFGGFKHPNALRYEVALSLANNAKCSVGDQMHPYGFMDEATYELIGTAYAEVEKVEEYCYGATSVADIGLLTAESQRPGLGRVPAPDVGACRILLEGNYLFDVLDGECDFNKYKLLILPDVVTVSPEIKEKLNAYVANGGKLLCTGGSGMDAEGNTLFDLGARIRGKSEFSPAYYHPTYKAMGLSPTDYVIYSPMYDTTATDTCERILGYSRNTFFNRTPEHFCSHKHTPSIHENNAPAVTIGKDGAYIAYEIFKEYAEVGSYIAKDTVMRVLDELLAETKAVETNLPSAGVVTLNRQEAQDRHVLHLLYASPVGRGKDVDVIEDLVPIHGTAVTVRLDRPVKRVLLVPQNEEISFTEQDGACRFTVDCFTCSQLVVLE